jgi:hypothetical protein
VLRRHDRHAHLLHMDQRLGVPQPVRQHPVLQSQNFVSDILVEIHSVQYYTSATFTVHATKDDHKLSQAHPINIKLDH